MAHSSLKSSPWLLHTLCIAYNSIFPSIIPCHPEILYPVLIRESRHSHYPPFCTCLPEQWERHVTAVLEETVTFVNENKASLQFTNPNKTKTMGL